MELTTVQYKRYRCPKFVERCRVQVVPQELFRDEHTFCTTADLQHNVTFNIGSTYTLQTCMSECNIICIIIGIMLTYIR